MNRADRQGLGFFAFFAFPAIMALLCGGGLLGFLFLAIAAAITWSVRYQCRIAACWQTARERWVSLGDID